MPKVHVIDHAVSWNEVDDLTKTRNHTSAKRGEEVDIPDAALARFKKLQERDGLPRVGTREEYEAWMAGMDVTPGALPPVTDAALQTMTPEQVIAHLNNTNGDAARVLELEEARPKPRKAIVDQANGILKAAEQLETPY